jgi:hypothetical protein
VYQIAAKFSLMRSSRHREPCYGTRIISLSLFLHRRLGEHRRWSQNGHNKSAILTS